MKISVVFAVFCMFSGLSGTAMGDQKLNVNIPGGGAQDLLNLTTIPPEISNSGGDPSLLRSCTNPSGRVIRQGEDGYEHCLAVARSKKVGTNVTTSPDRGVVVHSQ